MTEREFLVLMGQERDVDVDVALVSMMAGILILHFCLLLHNMCHTENSERVKP